MSAAAKQKIKTRYNEIWQDDEGFLWVRATEVTEIDLEEVKACFEAYAEMGIDQEKVLQVMDVRNSITVTREARDYAARHGHRFFIASAVISNSLSVRLIVNFFNFLYPKKVPLKMFGSEDEALKWLRKFRK